MGKEKKYTILIKNIEPLVNEISKLNLDAIDKERAARHF